ncbi:bacteriocin-like protein [Chryseobacterium sp.]|uniref:bacteriocin-like protein n=1 Tax=unclassified Chryseobacterium TaxID=2593645 RepID=UPI000A65C24B
MKNLKKLSKKNLKEITGGVAAVCPSMFQSCDEWCRWSPWQKSHCMLSQPCTECFE